MSFSLDTVRRVSTPEGVELKLHIAGPIVRSRAWFVDFCIKAVIYLFLAIVLGGLGKGVFLVCAFVLEWFYPILFEVFMKGQTPGKQVCKIMVLNDDGRPVGWNASFIRNTMRFVDFLPFLNITAVICSILNKDAKRIGDIAAGTIVVYTESVKTMLTQDIDEFSGVVQPEFPLSLEEQQAIIEYRLRGPYLTMERSLELAEIFLPDSSSLSLAKAEREKILAMGNYILGRKK